MRIGSLAGPLEVGGDYYRWIQAARSDRATPDFYDPNAPEPNVGDWFVTKIVDRLIDFDEVMYITPWSTPRDWDELNETCELLVLKGGNMLYPGWFEEHLPPELLEHVKIPILLFGAGIQNVPAGGVPFTPDDLRSLRIIHDHCDSSSVRGHLSAQVLADHGIHNATPTGCPTLFWSRQPALPLRPPSYERVGFTLRRYLFSDDLSQESGQFDTIRALRSMAADLVVVLQGEDRALFLVDLIRTTGAEWSGQLSHKHGDGSRLLVKQRLNAEALLRGVHDDLDEVAGADLVDWLVEHTFSSWDPDAYVEFYRSCGLMVGCRLHSNLVALANGTPSYFLTYDDRTTELAELIGAPHAPVAGFDVARLAEADWGGVAARYRDELYPAMIDFLDRNRVPHHLPVPEVALSS